MSRAYRHPSKNKNCRKNIVTKKKVARFDRGASLTEYGVVTGLIAAVAIGALASTGHEVSSIYNSAKGALIGGEDGAGGGTSEEGAPVQDPYVADVDESSWLVLTDASDTAEMAGEPGVYGKDGDDLITGTTGGEIFIGGPGDDTFDGAGGVDTFVYSLGDGSDYISVYESRYKSADQKLELRDIASTDVKLSQTNSSTGDGIITMPDGSTITIYKQMSATRDYKVEAIEFSDMTFNDQQFRDRVVADMKAEGATLRGSDFGENYFHYDGDPSYTIRDYQEQFGTHNDILTFVDASPQDAEFINMGTDLEIRVGGSVVTLYRHDHLNDDYFIEEIKMLGAGGNVSYDPQDVRDKADHDAKKYGYVNGFRHPDHFFHSVADDEDYTINAYSNLIGSNSFDSLEFIDATSDQATFIVRDDDYIVTVGNGTGDTDTITLIRQAHFSSDYHIESFIFPDRTLNAQEMRDKASHDAKPTGEVQGGDHTNNYTHTAATDPSYEIFEHSILRNAAGDDTLTFADQNPEDITVYQVGSDAVIYMVGGTGVLTINRQFGSSDEYQIESFRFADGTSWTISDLENAITSGSPPDVDPKGTTIDN